MINILTLLQLSNICCRVSMLLIIRGLLYNHSALAALSLHLTKNGRLFFSACVSRTLSRWSLPPELRVQIRKCLVKRKHCLSPSFLSEREPRRTLLSFPLSTEGNWIKEPERKRPEKRENVKLWIEWHNKLRQQSNSSANDKWRSKTPLPLDKILQEEREHGRFLIKWIIYRNYKPESPPQKNYPCVYTSIL